MARQFPRFLYSNPQNTKSEGPFIVHLLPPRKLYRVEWLFVADDANLHEIKEWGDRCTEDESRKVLKDLIKWFNQKLKSKEIVYPLSVTERGDLLKNSLGKDIRKNLKTNFNG